MKALCHPVVGGVEEDIILEPTSMVVWGPRSDSLMTIGVVGRAGGTREGVSLTRCVSGPISTMGSWGRRGLLLRGWPSTEQEPVSHYCPSNYHLVIGVLSFSSFKRRVYGFNHHLPFKPSFFVWVLTLNLLIWLFNE